MAAQICDHCGKLFDHKDLIKAVVLTRFIALKSARTYAMEKPIECLEMFHSNCQFPQTGVSDGD